jgi:hypothetical protein
MKTKRNKLKTNKTKTNKTKTNKTKTKKNRSFKPSLKILKIGYPLFAAKSYEGSTILKYNKEQEEKYNDKCLMENSSWFGDLKVAKSYKTKDNHIYKWSTNKKTKLLNINQENERFINDIFSRTNIKLIPTINLSKEEITKVKYENPYLNMTSNERALYEFKFCFGFITVKEQYEFMKFIKYLIENKFTDIKKRDGKSILNKLKLKIKYYEIASLLGKKEKFNRLSFYDFDKHAIMNLCKIVNEYNMNIAGVYQKNDTSFWFPDLIVYKMDIQEYILFDPQDYLVYDKMIL